MAWYRVTLRLPPEAADWAGWVAGQCGACGVEVQDPDPGDSRATTLVAYFSSGVQARRAARRLHEEVSAWVEAAVPAAPPPDGSGRRASPIQVGIASFSDRAWRLGWQQAWARTLAPVRVGSFEVVARGRGGPPSAGIRPIRLIIPPSMAFGTGHHPTTQQALWALETELAGRAAAVVADVGTGTGVLAIAARRLGASRVVAVDTDPLAVAAARENARRNGVTRVVVRRGSVDAARRALAPRGADVVVANLLAEWLVQLAGPLATLVEPGGLFIGAGIVAGRLEEVAEAIERQGLGVEAWGSWGGWAWIAGRRAS
ncbi:MAG: 50S ribosomal protein L11 methyltransferase [Limnochordaceae bacterium]|nr:50S ribosomal protein L11 methyltransferase [Limnochordaceae bacterium]